MVLQANRVESWRWPCDFAYHYYCTWALGLLPNCVVLVLGNEDGGPHLMQGCYTRDLWIGLRKLVVLTLNIHQIFN
jgi:hypothetical protein